MCYKMRRFEKIAEEKRRLGKEQDLSFALEGQPEIHPDATSESGHRRVIRKQKTMSR